MDRRAARALLALAACIASSAAAPTASNQTALDLYESAPEGCYYNFQHYGEGDRIMTNEPCLNCTCHNRMLMCYLRVCPFTKAIGSDCTVEKRADQCCPIVTCPDVPVDLLTSTSTTSPAEYGATGLGKLDKYGCSISGKYFPEGSKVPPTPNKPCEHCYCIRNMTTCVMQECTLHVDGCTPIYHKDVCCPVRYSCDHPDDEVPLLDDMSTTVRPTPGFLLTTTTVSPVTQMTQDCVHDDQVFSDGALIKTEKACEHCYCMKGDIVCVVQECGAPMENEGKNCTSLPPREGQCCPDTYICEGDELTSELPTDSTTESIIEKLTTLAPPRRTSVEGSGYRNEPDEAPYTEMPIIGTEGEGSGDEQETSKPFGTDEMLPTPGDDDQYIYVTTKSPPEENEEVTAKINEPDEKDKTVEPHVYPSTTPVSEEENKYTTSQITEEETIQPHVATTKGPESEESPTTELEDSQNTVPDVIPDEELDKSHEYPPSTTNTPTSDKSENLPPTDVSSETEQEATTAKHSASPKPQDSTPSSYPNTFDDIEVEENPSTIPSDISSITPELTTGKEYSDEDITKTTIATSIDEKESATEKYKESSLPEQISSEITTSPTDKDKESLKPEELAPSTIGSTLKEEEKITKTPDHALNTVAITEEESTHPYLHIESTTSGSPSGEKESSMEVTDKVTKEDILTPHEDITTSISAVKETEVTTAEPDKELNTIPIETHEETSSEATLPGRTTAFEEAKETESSIGIDDMQTHGIEVTKADQFTITTEPSFRKEDEIIVSTVKPKEPTTIKSEFVDEGLIPTSPHDKYDTNSDAPTLEEEITTSVPEYVTEVAESVGSKQTTTESVKDTVTDKVSEPSSDEDSELPSSTEKSSEITPLIETHEEASRIPGEGDCLLNGVTYRNNTVVPSTNNCHTGCRCASSIIKCDPIICSPPPDYMANCQSIYDSPDSCCPTFVCDHPRETVPPQSDNQMSGTEAPTASPSFECRGDQCEINEPTKQTTGTDHKTEVECGSEGCADVPQKPETAPSLEQAEDCSNGKCKPVGCADDECQSPQTPVSPVTPCEGENCEKFDKPIPDSPELCKNEEECTKLEVPTVQYTPCEGESCKKLDCGVNGCDSDINASPPVVQQPDHQPESCKDEDGCKPQDISDLDCTGEEPCRRKETSDSHEKESTAAQSYDGSSTELPKIEETPSKETTEKIEPAEDNKTTEHPDIFVSKPDNDDVPVQDTQEIDRYTTEGQTDIQKEKPSIIEEEEEHKGTTSYDEKQTETPATHDDGINKEPLVDMEVTEEPAMVDKEENIHSIEKTTESTMSTEKDVEQTTVVEEKEKDTEKTALVDEQDITDKPVSAEKEGTQKPSIETESTELPTRANEEDQQSHTESSIEPDNTKKPAVTEKDATTVPSSISIDNETTDSPAIDTVDTEKPLIDEVNKDKPIDTEKDITQEPALDQDRTEIPHTGEEEEKEKPVDVKETEKLDIEDNATEKPETETTDKEIVEGEETESPDVIKEETTTKAAVTDEEEKEKPSTIQEEDVEIPVTKDSTEIPTIIDEEVTRRPVVIEDDIKEHITVATVDQVSTEKSTSIDDTKPEKSPEIEETPKEKPTVDTMDMTDTPNLANEEKSSESPEIIIDQDTDKPSTDDNNVDKPVLIDENDKEKPEDVPLVDTTKKPEREGTELPFSMEDTNTEQPSISDEEKPVMIDEGGIKKPDIDKDEVTLKPFTFEEESTGLPDVAEDKVTAKPVIIDDDTEVTESLIPDEQEIKKPASVDDEDKKKPDLADQDDIKQPEVSVEETGKPDIIKESTEEPAESEQDKTEKPGSVDEEYKPVDEEDATKPSLVKNEEQGKPVTDKKDEPSKPDKKVTDEPDTNEVGTEDIKSHDEEGSGIEIPETPPMVKPEKEVKVPEKPVQSSEFTESPEHTTETETEEPIDVSTPSQMNEIPDIKVTASDESDIKKPVIHDHTRVVEITTESLLQHELTTKIFVPEHETVTVSEQQLAVTTFRVETSDTKYDSSTVGHELISDETLSTEAPALHKTSESVEKATETAMVGEPEETFTDTSEIESSTTKIPESGPVIIEPQEGIDADKPEKETTTKVYQEDKTKPMLEPEVTEVSPTSPQYEKSDQVTDQPKPELPESQDIDSDKKTTQLPVDQTDTVHPEIYSSDKENTVTESSEYAVTEPVKRFTEIEDPSITGQEDMITGYPEHQTPSVPSKLDEIEDSGITSSDKPHVTDIGSDEKSSEADDVITKTPEQGYQAPESEKEKPGDLDLPVTEVPTPTTAGTQEISHIPEKDITSYEEQPSTVSDLSDQKYEGTTRPEVYTELPEPTLHDVSHHHKATTEKDLYETSTKTVEEVKYTQTSEREGEPGTLAPEVIHTETQDQDKEIEKLTTESPLEDIHTEMPGTQLSSDIPQSLITEPTENLSEQTTVSNVPEKESTFKPESQTTQHEDISKTPEKHVPGVEVQTEAPISITQSVEVSTKSVEPEDKVTQVPVETVTEKQDTATTLRESAVVTEDIEQSEVTKYSEFTSAQTETSETTPYLIELEEHTHKPLEDISTLSPLDEEHSSKPVEDVSTSSPSEEEYSSKPEEDNVTLSPSEEEESPKPVEDSSTSSPSKEEESSKPVEDSSTSSPSEEEESPKPVEDSSTSSPSKEEDLSKPVEDSSTSSPSEEEESPKPVEDSSTSSPSKEEESSKPVEDSSTSLPSEEEESSKPIEDSSTSSPSVEEEFSKPVEDSSTLSPSEEEESSKSPKDSATVAPSEEKDSSKPVEDSSTSSPSEEEDLHKPIEDMVTSSPSEEEHSHKPEENIPTLLPSEEEDSSKPIEDSSTSSPSEEEHSYKPVEDITTSLPSEEDHSYKPVEDITTSLPSDKEHPHIPAEGISTSSPSEEEHPHKPEKDSVSSSPIEKATYLPEEDITTLSPAEEKHPYIPVDGTPSSSPAEEEGIYKPVHDLTTSSPSEEEHSYKPVEDISTASPSAEDDTSKIEDKDSTETPSDKNPSSAQPESQQDTQVSELTTKRTEEDIEIATKETETTSDKPLSEDVSEKIIQSVSIYETTPAVIQGADDKHGDDNKDYTTSAPTEFTEKSPVVVTESEKLPISESDTLPPTDKEISTTEKASHAIMSHETTVPEDDYIFSTTKATTVRQGEDTATPASEVKPEEKPIETSEVPPSSTTTEISKPSVSDLQPTDEIPVPDEDGHFPPSGTSGYGEPDYVEEDQAFGPGTCRYGGKVYVSAQQIPRDDPCDFCFCFRSDIICLQQSCPPPIHGCHEEPIQGFCCPRYECPVSMATTVNVTTTTTTTTTTLPPHFPTHPYKGAAQRRGCQIKGHTYKVGEVVRSSSGPCLHCTCGGDGQMKCDPKACTPEPMLRQMIAAAVSAKRRR